MQDLKAEVTKKVKNIKVLLSIMDYCLKYYEELDPPHKNNIEDLKDIEEALKEFII